jgi:hypothetical protein
MHQAIWTFVETHHQGWSRHFYQSGCVMLFRQMYVDARSIVACVHIPGWTYYHFHGMERSS